MRYRSSFSEGVCPCKLQLKHQFALRDCPIKFRLSNFQYIDWVKGRYETVPIPGSHFLLCTATTSAVRFVKCFRSDTGGLASLGHRSGSVRRSAFGWMGWMDARYTHNLISKPHSVPPYTTELVVQNQIIFIYISNAKKDKF